MKNTVVFVALLAISLLQTEAQKKLLTVAESSDYKATSRYADVISFIDNLKAVSPYIRTENLATSIEGREIPLLIIGNPLPLSPDDLKNDGRIVVYIQANIHAGEVEGKDATLLYARDLLLDSKMEVLENVVLLICPIINPDGNEKIDPLNRTNQNGPVEGVGVRYNGQFLDLNRDAMKSESPEVRGVIKNVFNRWDPSVFMDCHTTNGSYHVEPVTFTWMVNPNGDNSLIRYMRDKMMPEMSKGLLNNYKVENCFYGEFFDMMDPDKGWVLEASEPRYMTNYFGLRNRLAILNENYVYADFRSRVNGCYYLIHSLINYASENKQEIKNLLEEADRNTLVRGSNPSSSDSFYVEYVAKPAPELARVKTYEAELVTNVNGRRSYRRTERRRDVTIPYYIDFHPIKSVRFPYAYILNIKEPEILALLKIHGIKLEKLSEDTSLEVDKFQIEELTGAKRLNQGHYTNTITGSFFREKIIFQKGTIVVRTAQPLANVAAYLLEPQSNDGLVTWNYLDRYLVPQWGAGYNAYPIFKLIEKADLQTLPYL